MAKDTKIGLLVGMGFIVCFAIILSHHDGVEPAPSGGTPDALAVAHKVPNSARTSSAGARTRGNVRSVRSTGSGARTTAQATPHRRSSVGSATKPPVMPPADAFVRAEPQRSSTTPIVARGRDKTKLLGDSDPRFTRRGAPIDPRSLVRGRTRPPGTPSARRSGAGEDAETDGDTPGRTASNRPVIDLSTPQGVLAAVAAGDESHAVSSPILPPQSRTTQANQFGATETRRAARVLGRQQLGTHEIAPGDTLTEIAQRYYGTTKAAVIDAICAANRDAITNPDRLIIGRKIVLPRLTDESTANAAEEIAAPDTSTPKDKSEPRESPASRKKGTYEVRPGDTLTRIARDQYASTSQSVIDAIYEANRSALSSPDRLIVGRRISLPDLGVNERPSTRSGALAAAPRDRTGAAEKGSRRKSTGRAGSWRWHQLKSGDTFGKVAAEQLGTAKRWRELAELNADIFPNPDRIRPGVKIRIPVGAGNARSVASARGVRR